MLSKLKKLVILVSLISVVVIIVKLAQAPPQSPFVRRLQTQTCGLRFPSMQERRKMFQSQNAASRLGAEQTSELHDILARNNTILRLCFRDDLASQEFDQLFHKSNYEQFLQEFRWEPFTGAAHAGARKQEKLMKEQLLSVLLSYAAMPPMISVNATCLGAEQKELKSQWPRCDEIMPGLFGGSLRPQPVRIIDMVILGFNIDVLEMRMLELDPIVDYFIIVEATMSEIGIRKPLSWAAVKNTPRFARFNQKTIHIIKDDFFAASVTGNWFQFYEQSPSNSHVTGPKVFDSVIMADLLRLYDKGVFDSQDVLVLADADEIPDPHLLQRLKYCQTKSLESTEPEGQMSLLLTGNTVDLLNPTRRTVGPSPGGASPEKTKFVNFR